MGGGGYANFISKLKCDSNSNCIAKFIVVDGDRAQTDSSEQKKPSTIHKILGKKELTLMISLMF